jgi:hypothetical protein
MGRLAVFTLGQSLRLAVVPDAHSRAALKLAVLQEVSSMPQKRMLLTSGLSLTLRNWPAFVWTYVFNLGLALIFVLPLHQQIATITAHSLASQRLTGAFDLGTLGGVILKLSQGPGPATLSSYFSTPFYLVLYFFIVPGTLFCYQTGTPATLFTLLQSGFVYFWRFVRITLITLVVSAPILAGLNTLQNLWSAHVDLNTVGRRAFLLDLSGLVLIGLVAAILRVYFDLVQVYTVQLGLIQFPADPGRKGRPERQIRRTFKPAWRTLRRNFFRLYITFVFLTLLGLAAVVVTARTAMHSLGQPRVWPMFLLAQLGLFLMLLTRFWQRGAEACLALENRIHVPAVVASATIVPEEPLVEPAPTHGEEQEVQAVPDIAVPEPSTEPPSSEI